MHRKNIHERGYSPTGDENHFQKKKPCASKAFLIIEVHFYITTY